MAQLHFKMAKQHCKSKMVQEHCKSMTTLGHCNYMTILEHCKMSLIKMVQYCKMVVVQQSVLKKLGLLMMKEHTSHQFAEHILKHKHHFCKLCYCNMPCYKQDTRCTPSSRLGVNISFHEGHNDHSVLLVLTTVRKR